MSEHQRQSKRTDREIPARLTPAQVEGKPSMPIPGAGGEEVIRAAATGESSSPTARSDNALSSLGLVSLTERYVLLNR